MPLRIVIFLLGFVFFLSPHIVEAGLVINEIMYDPAGSDGAREWIEVFNDTTSSLDLTTYKSDHFIFCKQQRPHHFF